MTIFEILKTAIALGLKSDFRPKKEIERFGWQEKIVNAAGEHFINYYPDTGVVLVKNLAKPVKRVAVGIDMSIGDLLLLEKFKKQSDQSVDLIITHHADGRLLASFPHIIKTQLGHLKSQKVATEGLKKYFDRKMTDLWLDTYSLNLSRFVDALRYLNQDCVGIHTPVDNLGARYVEQIIEKSKAKTLQECVEALLRLPEYKNAYETLGLSPLILVGQPRSKLGKFVLTEFTGGEEGPVQIYRRMKQANVKTILFMHLTPEAFREAKRLKLNVIAAGHNASDSIGLNLFCDIIKHRGIEIIPLGGFIRQARK